MTYFDRQSNTDFVAAVGRLGNLLNIVLYIYWNTWYCFNTVLSAAFKKNNNKFIAIYI